MKHAQKFNNRLIAVVAFPTVDISPNPPENLPLPDGAEWVLVSDNTPPESTWDGVQWVPPDRESEPLTRIEFLRRFSATKRIAIRSAAKTNPIVEDFMDLLSAADVVHLDDPDVLAGVGYMVAQGFITQQEADLILLS